MKEDKLFKLKNSHRINTDPNSNGGKKAMIFIFDRLKTYTKLKLKSITIISLIIGIIFFTTNLFASSFDSYSKSEPYISSISQKLSNIVSALRSDRGLEKTYEEFETVLKDFQKEISNLNQKFWPLISFDDISNEAWLLSKDWLSAISDLAKFKIGAEGFTSNLSKNFTVYLEIFFENLPNLINRTEKFVDKVTSYVSWMFWLPNSNIKKIQSLTTIIQDGIDILWQLYDNRNGILLLLGNKKPHKILIFNQNVGESRPTGGFIGSYLPINITQGRFDIGKSESIYNIDDTLTKNMISFPASWYYDLQYGRYESHGVRNLNYFSCFKDSASLIESEFNLSTNGQSSDTVIFLTPNLIQNLFTSETELKIDLNQYRPENEKKNTKDEVVINRTNFYEVIERITAIEFEDPNNPKSAITPILLAIVNNLEMVLAKQDQFELFIQWLKSGFTRDVQLWSKDRSLQDIWEMFNFSGNQTCFDQIKDAKCQNWWAKLNDSECKNYEYIPVLAFLQANISSDKRDIFAEHNFEIKVDRGITENNVSLTYKRSYKNLENLQRRFNSRNGVTFLAFQLPKDAWQYSIESDQSFKTPFERPFYQLKLQEIKQKEVYVSKPIQEVLNSSRDISPKSFIYRQPDQSLVIGTYINEDSDLSMLELRFKTKNANLVFYPAPANNNSYISVDNNSRAIDIVEQNKTNFNTLINSQGQAIIIGPKVN